MEIDIKFEEDTNCSTVAEVLVIPGQKVKKDQILVLFSDREMNNFFQFKSELYGKVSRIYVAKGDDVKINSNVLCLTEVNPFDGHDRGCIYIGLSIVFSLCFIVYYSLFPTYSSSFLNTNSNEIDRIQFWIGLIGTILFTSFIIKLIIKRFSTDEIRLIHGSLAIFVFYLLSWFFIPDILIDLVGDIILSTLKALLD